MFDVIEKNKSYILVQEFGVNENQYSFEDVYEIDEEETELIYSSEKIIKPLVNKWLINYSEQMELHDAIEETLNSNIVKLTREYKFRILEGKHLLSSDTFKNMNISQISDIISHIKNKNKNKNKNIRYVVI